MADPNEIDFVVKVHNEDKLRNLERLIAQTEEQVRNLKAAAVQSGQGFQQFLAAATPLGARLKDLNQQANETRRALSSMSFNGQGLMQIGYVIDDLQYGFGAVVNNIGPLVAGLGGGAGVAAMAQIAAVALAQLTKHFGDLRDIVAGAWLGEPAEKMAKMREHAEAATEAFKKLSAVTRGDREQAKAVGEAIEEGPKDRVVAHVMEAMADEPGFDRGLSGQDKKMLRQYQDFLRDPNVGRDEKMEARIQADALRRKAAEFLVGEATLEGPEGDPARKILETAIRKNPGKFPRGMMADLQSQDAANRAMGLPPQEELERQGDLNAANLAGKAKVEAIEEAKRKKRLEVQREVNQKIKHDEEEQKRRLEERLRAERNAAHQRRDLQKERIQDRNEQLHKQEQLLERGMNPDQIRRAEDKFFGVKKPEHSMVLSTKAMVDRTLTRSLSGGDQKTIDKLVDIKKELEKNREELKKLNRLH